MDGDDEGGPEPRVGGTWPKSLPRLATLTPLPAACERRVSRLGYGSSVANWITTSSQGSRCEAVLLGKAAVTIAGLVFLIRGKRSHAPRRRAVIWFDEAVIGRPFVPPPSASRMTSWSKIAAFLLLLLWLPATQYSGLEAAGVAAFGHDDHASPICQDACAVDVCHATGGLSLEKTMSSVRVLPPSPLAVRRCLELLLEQTQEPVDPDATYGERCPGLLVLQRSWSFALRTALPARAPDFVA